MADKTTTKRIVRWQGLSGSEREHLVLMESDKEIFAESVFMSSGGADAFALRYRLVLDLAWSVNSMEAHVVGSDNAVHLRRDTESGAWFDSSGKEMSELNGATDVDLSITPFTNSLPINRLKLEVGQSKEITVVYVTVPEMTIMADPQRYTRTAKDKYLFESVDTEFQRELEVDAQGLVVHYPGWFARIT